MDGLRKIHGVVSSSMVVLEGIGVSSSCFPSLLVTRLVSLFGVIDLGDVYMYVNITEDRSSSVRNVRRRRLCVWGFNLYPFILLTKLFFESVDSITVFFHYMEG